MNPHLPDATMYERAMLMYVTELYLRVADVVSIAHGPQATGDLADMSPNSSRRSLGGGSVDRGGGGDGGASVASGGGGSTALKYSASYEDPSDEMAALRAENHEVRADCAHGCGVVNYSCNSFKLLLSNYCLPQFASPW